MASAFPGSPQPESELPAPLPWLERVGPVEALDRPRRAEPAKASAPARPSEPVKKAEKNEPASKDAPAKPAPPKKSGPKRPGSGIPARPIIRTLVWVRRVAQVGFFALFFWFLCSTAFRGTFSAKFDQPVRLPLPVEAFLLADPFVGTMPLLRPHPLHLGPAWSVVLIARTLVFGRVFCGWICPFGTLHHFLGCISPRRYLRGAKRVESNKTHGWQAAKYY